MGSASRMRKHRAARAEAGLPQSDKLRAWIGDAFTALAKSGEISTDLKQMIASEVARSAENKVSGDSAAIIGELLHRWK